MDYKKAAELVEYGKKKGWITQGYAMRVVGNPVKEPKLVAIQEAAPNKRDLVQCPSCSRIVEVVTFGKTRTIGRHNINALHGGVRCQFSGREVINQLKALA
jgi:hypothetical protein